MASSAATASDTNTRLSVTTPSQISNDVPGPDNVIPLSPQWLLPKPVDNKAGTALGENHPTPYVGHGDRSDVIKPPRHGDEMHESQKKKDVFRPTFLDMESGRRDRWRDEERDTNLSARKDRWREGDKDIGDNRKTDRWVDNSPARHFGEARRAPADRWVDPSKETDHEQRHDSKWNSRWGPGDKEMNKGTDTMKYNDPPFDKGLPNLPNPGKDESESERYRPWRPSGRGRADPPHHQAPMTSKEVPTFNHGRGRGDSAPLTFSAARGRVTPDAERGRGDNRSNHYQSSSFMHERGDNVLGEQSPFRYSRTKLLDIFLVIDRRSSPNILDGLTQAPSLTQEEPLEPLGLCAPTPEESAILKGIDKGDIVSSGAPQISKDGSSGRSSVDFATSRQRKPGSREDVPSAADDHQRYTENKHSGEARRDEAASTKRGDEVVNNRDANIKDRASAQSENPWRPATVAGPPNAPSRNSFDNSNDNHSRNSDMTWSQARKERQHGRDNVLPDPSRALNELKSQGGEHSRTLSQPSPDVLLLYYKDPQGLIQGPFSGSDHIIGWFEAGYFGIDLLVRLASAPNDSPFSLLGDVMPHLRAKARPPPGFNSAKQTNVISAPNSLSISGLGNAIPSVVDLIENEHRHAQSSSIEAKNRFLESLISGESKSSALERFASEEGLQGFNNQISVGMPAVGAESGDPLGLLPKRMNLERPESLSSYPNWPPRDATPIIPSPHLNRNSSIPLVNPLSPVADVPRQSHPQTVEMMSPLKGLSDRSSGSMNNNELGGWPNLHLGSESFKDKLDMPYGQNFPQAAYSLQQHNLQPQNQPSLPNLFGQTLDSQGMMTEKLLSTGLNQNPQLLSLLQQQYLLQLQSQQPVASPQLSMLDRLLLLQQQQKQGEQHKLLQQQLILQQQQQLLSKVLSEQQLVQRFGDQSFGQLQASEQSPQLLNQNFQVNSQFTVPSMLNDRNAHEASMHQQASRDLSRTDPSESTSSLRLPHQILGGFPNSWSSVVAQHGNLNNSTSVGSAMMETSVTVGAGKSQSDTATAELSAPLSMGQTLHTISDPTVSALVAEHVSAESKLSTTASNSEALKLEVTNDAVLTNDAEVSTVKDSKDVESRELKKTSEKKSRKQKSSKAQKSTDQVKPSSKGSSVQHSKQSTDAKVVVKNQSEDAVAFPGSSIGDNLQKEGDVLSSEVVSAFEAAAKVDQSTQRAWKPAVTVRPKSLLEIQQEEQRRSLMDIPVRVVSPDNSRSYPTPWAGIAGDKASKVIRDDHLDNGITVETNMEILESSNKKGGLHNLLAAENFDQSSGRNIDVHDIDSGLPPLPTMSKQLDTADDASFIEAKETKKSRKKAAKAKGATGKASTTVADLTVSSSPVEKGKNFKPAQAEKEVMPAPPSGPSLGDFVPWKGESTSPSPVPAWLSESAKFPKPASLRDILREQEKKVTLVHSQIPNSQKPQSALTSAGSGSVLISPTSKAAGPVMIPSEASSQPKVMGEDDLFWGPPEQSKQETKQAGFPQLGNSGGRSTKSTPVKGTPGASLSKQKSGGSKALQHNVSSPPPSAQISTKGKRDVSTKRSDAVDFRDWCVHESVRLTGSRDTSFLEYCSKQTKSEAEILLKENLSAVDPNHEFIEKFLNYMDLLPPDVIDIAFQTQNHQKAYNNGAGDTIPDYGGGLGHFDSESKVSSEGLAKGGKKKGKKGKKVSPSVLGFNVVSNRIMMGEIQTLDD